MPNKTKLYKVYSFRLDDRTVEQLQLARGKQSWNKFLLEMLRTRSGICCKICNKIGELEIHHIIPRSLGGTNENSNLMFLCLDCHKKIHHPKK